MCDEILRFSCTPEKSTRPQVGARCYLLFCLNIFGVSKSHPFGQMVLVFEEEEFLNVFLQRKCEI
jgi:hypothetical protein